MKNAQSYHEIEFPLLRKLVIDSSRLARKKSAIYGLVEFDITETIKKIRQYRIRTKSPLSLTAYIIFCIGKAVEARKEVHGYLSRNDKLVCFDDVDLCLFIEMKIDEHNIPIAHILRSVNKRSFQDIEREIRKVKDGGVSDPETRQQLNQLRRFFHLPSFVRRIIYYFILRNPHRFKKKMGTVAVTAVGMFGKGSGWGVGLLNHTLEIVIGGNSVKPVIIKGKMKKREILSVTIAMDHDIIDGAPGVRFTQGLKDLVEKGYGLEDDT